MFILCCWKKKKKYLKNLTYAKLINNYMIFITLKQNNVRLGKKDYARIKCVSYTVKLIKSILIYYKKYKNTEFVCFYCKTQKLLNRFWWNFDIIDTL